MATNCTNLLVTAELCTMQIRGVENPADLALMAVALSITRTLTSTDF